MNPNPYITRQSSLESADDELLATTNASRNIGTALAWFDLFPCLGGVIGFAGYIITGLPSMWQAVGAKEDHRPPGLVDCDQRYPPLSPPALVPAAMG